jgi:hypothetical protein
MLVLTKNVSQNCAEAYILLRYEKQGLFIRPIVSLTIFPKINPIQFILNHLDLYDPKLNP